jgi:hypothetical protein
MALKGARPHSPISAAAEDRFPLDRMACAHSISPGKQFSTADLVLRRSKKA